MQNVKLNKTRNNFDIKYHTLNYKNMGFKMAQQFLSFVYTNACIPNSFSKMMLCPA